MKISRNKVVFMTYELEVEGKIVDKAEESRPLDYIQGTNMLIPKLEEKVEGLEQGDEFSCTIAPEDAYGEYDLSKVFDIPKSSFAIDGKVREDLLEIGRFIPMLNSAGDVCHGMIVEVKENDVTMDFNPPMAGKTLNFKGKIISVRDATDKELNEGLHGEFLPEPECGCGCGGHHHGHGENCGCGGHHHEHGEGCGCGHEHGEGCCHHHGDEDGCCHS